MTTCVTWSFGLSDGDFASRRITANHRILLFRTIHRRSGMPSATNDRLRFTSILLMFLIDFALQAHSAGVGLVRVRRYPWLNNRAPFNNISFNYVKNEYIVSTSATTSQREPWGYVRFTGAASPTLYFLRLPHHDSHPKSPKWNFYPTKLRLHNANINSMACDTRTT